jgi:hypothetical protein
MRPRTFIAAIAAAIAMTPAAEALDESLPSYQAIPGSSRQSVGSEAEATLDCDALDNG